jgi:hypothetical protein
MNKTVSSLIVVGALLFSVLAFAQQEQVTVNGDAVMAVDAGINNVGSVGADGFIDDADSAADDDFMDDEEEIVTNDLIDDEGYGNDEEYFGAEVGGEEDGYLDEAPLVEGNAGDFVVNQEIENQ